MKGPIKMNILFCGDKNITDGVIISTLSLLKCAREPLNIFILTASVDAGEKKCLAIKEGFAVFLDSLVKEHGAENSVRLFDISEEFNKELPTANMKTRFTPCCMLRLYADLVTELPERLLYLDNDVICRKGISDFYYTDMNGAEIGGVLDYYGSHFFKKNIFKRDYLNSGVLLLDMKMIRSTGLFKICRDMCRDKKMFMPDQSALNKLAINKYIFPRKYNEQRKLHTDTVFQHFTTSFRFFPWFHKVSVKPWNIEGMHKTLKLFEYDGLLEEYKKIKEKDDFKGEKTNVQ